MDSESKLALVSLMKWLGSEINNGSDGNSQNALQRTKQVRDFRHVYEDGVISTNRLDLYHVDGMITQNSNCR